MNDLSAQIIETSEKDVITAVNALKSQIKIDNIGVISNLLTILSEQFQNIMNYSKSSDIDNEEVVSKGLIKLQDTKSQYVISSKNIISLEDRKKIEPKLEEISRLDRQGIRKRYKELRRSGEGAHAKGGGVGFGGGGFFVWCCGVGGGVRCFFLWFFLYLYKFISALFLLIVHLLINLLLY